MSFVNIFGYFMDIEKNMVTKTNPNHPGTLEYAVRHAMNSLGRKKVAEILGCSESRLYKATQANPSRTLPDMTFSQISAIVTMLKNQRSRRKYMQEPDRAEYFSDVLRSIGRVKTIPTHDVHECMTMATRDCGHLASTLIDVTNQQAKRGSKSLTVDEANQCAIKGRQAMFSIGRVIEVCDFNTKTAAHKS